MHSVVWACRRISRRNGWTRPLMANFHRGPLVQLSMSFLQDVRFGMRMLAKNPGFTAVVVITLALGIGANTTVFTLVNAVLFKGLPFEHAERVMHLSGNNLSKGRNRIGVSYPDFADWR